MPQSAPRSSPRLGGSNPRLGPFFRILTFSTAVFCYIQLASSSAVPGVPWDSHGELIVCIFSCQNQLFVHKSQILYTLLESALFIPRFMGHSPVKRSGCGLYYAPARASSRVHRSCADGRASTRHLHGTTERAARCGTVKVPAESADAVSR